MRNEGLRCVPQDIIEEAIDIARATMRGDFDDDPNEAKKKLLDAFAAVRVSPKMLEDYLGHKTDEISVDEWEELRSIYQGIREGSTTWRDLVEGKKGKPSPAPAQAADRPAGDPSRGGVQQ